MRERCSILASLPSSTTSAGSSAKSNLALGKAQLWAWRTGPLKRRQAGCASHVVLVAIATMLWFHERSCSRKVCRLNSLLWSRFLKLAEHQPRHCLAPPFQWICKDSEFGCRWTRLPAPALISREFRTRQARACVQTLCPSSKVERNESEREDSSWRFHRQGRRCSCSSRMLCDHPKRQWCNRSMAKTA